MIDFLTAVEYDGILDIVVGSLHETIESAMNLIILSRLDLNRKNGQTLVVVNKEIHLPALFVVVIVKLAPMRMEFLRHDRFID